MSAAGAAGQKNPRWCGKPTARKNGSPATGSAAGLLQMPDGTAGPLGRRPILFGAFRMHGHLAVDLHRGSTG